MLDLTVGFIGAGQMAQALAVGFIRKGLVSASQVLASDPQESVRERFHQLTGSSVTDNNLEVVRGQDIIVLAIKPQVMGRVMAELRGRISPEKLVVSIVAGVPIQELERGLGENIRVVRVMPNTAALIGYGATAYALGTKARAEDARIVGQMFEAVGLAVQVDESMMDAVTALSGSGPAFVYLFIEALIDAGVRHGLPRPLTRQLVTQTVRGSAEMLVQSAEHPAVLRDRVTSPGGTTIAGLAALEEHGLRASVLAAVQAAYERSRQLSK